MVPGLAFAAFLTHLRPSGEDDLEGQSSRLPPGREMQERTTTTAQEEGSFRMKFPPWQRCDAYQTPPKDLIPTVCDLGMRVQDGCCYPPIFTDSHLRPTEGDTPTVAHSELDTLHSWCSPSTGRRLVKLFCCITRPLRFEQRITTKNLLRGILGDAEVSTVARFLIFAHF